MFPAMKIFAGLFVFACALGVAHAETTLTVSAAVSLKDALTKVQALYAQPQPEVKLTFNFAGSGVLQHQIEAGAPVDVFIAAAAAPMDALEKHALLLAGTRRVLLTNHLVLITPKDAALVREFRDLEKSEVRHIAIGDPKSVPAGAYAAEVLAALGLVKAVESKLVRLLDVRQVLTTVETGNAEAGFVYLTDARLSEKIRVAVTATADLHSPIVYPVAVIAVTKQPEAAKAFTAFLASEPARAVFAQFGFGGPP